MPGPASLLPHLVLCGWEDVGRLSAKRDGKSLEGAASSKLNVRFFFSCVKMTSHSLLNEGEAVWVASMMLPFR